MSMHEVAAAGFSRSAGDYERARPEYPDAALAWLAERLGLGKGTAVLDLAAGTGKLTRRLAALGADVVAVEPLDEMRAAIGGGIRALAGTAEAIPVPDTSADVVTVAQAFHWFDGDRALTEIHRVLRPGGALALLWNARRMEDPIHVALEELMAPYTGSIPRHRSGAWRAAFERTTLFGVLEERQFDNEQRLDADGLVGRVASTSAIAALRERKRALVLGRVRALAGGGETTLRYLCEVQVARRR